MNAPPPVDPIYLSRSEKIDFFIEENNIAAQLSGKKVSLEREPYLAPLVKYILRVAFLLLCYFGIPYGFLNFGFKHDPRFATYNLFENFTYSELSVYSYLTAIFIPFMMFESAAPLFSIHKYLYKLYVPAVLLLLLCVYICVRSYLLQDFHWYLVPCGLYGFAMTVVSLYVARYDAGGAFSDAGLEKHYEEEAKSYALWAQSLRQLDETNPHLVDQWIEHQIKLYRCKDLEEFKILSEQSPIGKRGNKASVTKYAHKY